MDSFAIVPQSQIHLTLCDPRGGAMGQILTWPKAAAEFFFKGGSADFERLLGVCADIFYVW